MATPNSTAMMSDIEPASSPPAHIERSFMTAQTEDDDTRLMATPEPSERQGRGKKRGRGGGGDDGGPNGNPIGKIRHLKKEDGEPLWRKDIQFDFLKAVFDNEAKVFTNSYEKDRIGKQCFADLYIDTMSRSSKTSKVLRDKLLSDREAAKGMAMVCLLVNIGRMNTTLNFFPEMRAQLRTYHAIPSLQARQDPHAYKQLQDAPRLKSILKGGSDDRIEPSTLDDIKALDVPRTNPVNLLFLICQAAPKIAELHFPPSQEFHDLVMKFKYSSESRARAFLWLMWFYLESDFTEEGCEENPFGAGVDYGVDVANQGVPRLELLSEEDAALENVDTQEEVDFGYAKQKMRAKIIEADQQFMADSQTKRGGGRGRGFPAGEEVGPTTGILPRIRPSKNESDLDSVRSTPPPRALGRQSGVFGSMGRRGPHSLKYQVFDGSSPAADRMMEGVVARKPRPPTAHQIAVERNRSQRVEYILDRGIRRNHHQARKGRRGDGAILRALPRLAQMQDPFDDSDDDEILPPPPHNGKQGSSSTNGADSSSKKRLRERGYGGLAQLTDEPDDFGEQVSSYAAAFRRTARRLDRWETHDGPELGVIQPVKRPKPAGSRRADNDEDDFDDDADDSPSNKDMLIDPAETEDENDNENDEIELVIQARRRGSGRGRGRGRGRGSGRGRGRGSYQVNGRASSSLAQSQSQSRHQQARAATVDTNGDTPMDDADDLDEVDKGLLGLGDDDGDDGDENGDDQGDENGGDHGDENGDDDGDGDGDGEGEGEGDEGEDELDDVDKTLLGMDGDSDSE